MKKSILLSCLAFTCLFAKAQLKVIPSGYVSIGSTSSAGTKLQVFGVESNTTGIVADFSGTAAGGAFLQITDATNWNWGLGGRSGSTGDFSIFKDRYPGNVGTELLTILRSSGNVGIGITSPGDMLDVHKSISGAFEMRLTQDRAGSANSNADGDGTLIGFYQRNTSFGENSAMGGVTDVTNIDCGRLVFYTKPHSGSLTERMRITSTGAVGIGATPQYTLHVNGTAYCTSGAWASDIKLKKNINNLSWNALGIINKLYLHSYHLQKLLL